MDNIPKIGEVWKIIDPFDIVENKGIPEKDLSKIVIVISVCDNKSTIEVLENNKNYLIPSWVFEGQQCKRLVGVTK